MTTYINKVQLKYIEVDMANSSSELIVDVVFLFVSGQAMQNYLEPPYTHIVLILDCQPVYSIRAGFAKLFLCPTVSKLRGHRQSYNKCMCLQPCCCHSCLCESQRKVLET